MSRRRVSARTSSRSSTSAGSATTTPLRHLICGAGARRGNASPPERFQSRHSALVHGNRDTSTNLRYKHGANLRAEEKDAIRITRPTEWGLPDDFLNKNYLLAKEDRYFVYPTNFHEYERLYLDSFQHGGVSMEEVILPCAILRPRSGGA